MDGLFDNKNISKGGVYILNWQTFFPVLLSVGVVSAAIAAIANVIVTLLNNTRLKALEKDKRISELIQYRYVKLYGILEEICQLEALSYDISDEHIKETIHNVENRFGVIKKKCDLAKPLIQDSYIVKLNANLAKEQALSQHVIEHVYTNASNFGIRDLLMIRAETESLLVEAIQNQLASLLS